METCSNPGCSEPGRNRCAGCKTTPYCGPICQTAHWPTHKESCDGRLRKMGMDHLNKALGFYREKNWLQLLRHSDLALTKLMQLKDRPIEEISDAFDMKCVALGFLGRHREQLECATEWYCLWNTKPTDVGAIDAAFGLIKSCINNKEFTDAHLYASTLWEIINHKHDNKIPDDQRQRYIANGAYFLARATLSLAENEGIPPQEKQKAGQEAIVLARRALEIHTQLHGTENEYVAGDMMILAEALGYFIDDDDDEVLHLLEQSKVIYTRVYGSSSLNVATSDFHLGDTYRKRAQRAASGNDIDRYVANLNLALPRYTDAARIFRAVNHEEDAADAARMAVEIEERLKKIAITRETAATTKG